MVEEKFGQAVRYPKDCEALAARISDACKQQISASTIKRLYGFVKGIEQPRLYTLDVISNYLGHSSWENLLMSLNKQNRPSRATIEHLLPAQLKKGSVLEIGYEPNRMITIRYEGKNCFNIIHSTEKKLLQNDVITIQSADLHYPLLVSEIKRGEKNIGQCTLGSISGVTFIKKIQTAKTKK